MALTREMVQEMARRQIALQSLRVKFCNNREGIDALRVVHRNNTVTFDDGSIFAQAVIESEEWADHRGDRSFTVSSCQLLSDDCFLNHVESGVESISSGGDSPLKALQSSRQRKRQEAFDAIVEKCVTDEFREFVA